MGLNPDDSRPAYLQIADAIRESIRAGELGPGDQIPSTAELMSSFDVANMTVQNALRVLRDDELVYSRQGKGSFVRSDINDTGALAGASSDYLAIAQQLDSIVSKIDSMEKRLAALERQPVKKAK